MKIDIPEFSMVMLIGPAGCGKSSFARRHFQPSQILCADTLRAWVCDDENNQDASKDAFELLHMILRKRMRNQCSTVIDATNVLADSRDELLKIAQKHLCPVVALVFDLPEDLLLERNQTRTERTLPESVIHTHVSQLRETIESIGSESFRAVHHLTSVGELDRIQFNITPLDLDKRDDHGPFDIIGDVHGCYDELLILLEKLGYQMTQGAEGPEIRHPQNRRVMFLGDLVDRGPKIPEVLRLVMNAVKSGAALCVMGNHDLKLLLKLEGKKVKMRFGLGETMEQLESESEQFKAEIRAFIKGLETQYLLDDGKLVVAHAGLKESLHGKVSAKAHSFALYGDTTGETDAYGLPVRQNWARDYQGEAMVIYGHTPVKDALWENNTLCIDTGCVFGGKLTALQYPEKKLVEVEALEEYYAPVKPLS